MQMMVMMLAAVAKESCLRSITSTDDPRRKDTAVIVEVTETNIPEPLAVQTLRTETEPPLYPSTRSERGGVGDAVDYDDAGDDAVMSVTEYDAIIMMVLVMVLVLVSSQTFGRVSDLLRKILKHSRAMRPDFLQY